LRAGPRVKGVESFSFAFDDFGGEKLVGDELGFHQVSGLGLRKFCIDFGQGRLNFFGSGLSDIEAFLFCLGLELGPLV
jgi:hypothetical protein